MVCVGSGIAPFRGIIQERLRIKPSGASRWVLFYGCRGKNIDEMYASELEDAVSLGFLEVRRAYSRSEEGDGKPRYVTDALALCLGEVLELWRGGAVVCICAGKEVANNVWGILGPVTLQAEIQSGSSRMPSGDIDLTSWKQLLSHNSGSTWSGRYIEEVFN